MSNKLTTAVWELQLPRSHKSLLVNLADQANDAGFCWPSMSTIARRVGLQLRQTRRLIEELERCGWLKREARFRKSNIKEQTSNGYWLNVAKIMGIYADQIKQELDRPVQLGNQGGERWGKRPEQDRLAENEGKRQADYLRLSEIYGGINNQVGFAITKRQQWAGEGMSINDMQQLAGWEKKEGIAQRFIEQQKQGIAEQKAKNKPLTHEQQKNGEAAAKAAFQAFRAL